MTIAEFIDRKTALFIMKLAAVWLGLTLVSGCCLLEKLHSLSSGDEGVRVVYPAEKQ